EERLRATRWFGAQLLPGVRVAGAVHERPRERGRGGLVAGKEQPEHVAAQLPRRERPATRTRAHERAEHIVVSACAAARDDVVRVLVEHRGVLFHHPRRLADREGDEAVDLADLTADPADRFALVARDLLGPRAVDDV